MLKSRISKASIIALSMSFMLAIPAYAGIGSGHSAQIKADKMAKTNNLIICNEQLSIEALYTINNGIIKGNSNGNYKMKDKVKRGDMSIMIVRAFNLVNSSDATIENFYDVSKDSYYYEAIETIKLLGIAKGNGKKFNPNNNVTLEEAILFVERTLDVAGYNYSDQNIHDLFVGRSMSDFATREDISRILYSVLGNLKDTNTDTILYETDENTAITFDEDDFNDVCEDITGEHLVYIKFNIPSSSYGKLYYDYKSSSHYDSKVIATNKYYYASEDDDDYLLSKVTFVPASDYIGTVNLSYTGYNEDRETFTGIIRVIVE